MQLSCRQKNILIGTILGDAHLEKNGNNTRLKVDHGEIQKAYLKWKYFEFKNISVNPRLIKQTHQKTRKIYKRWHLSTYSLKELNFYRKLFYRNNKKIIPKNINELMKSSLSLAVWHMDDGHKRTDCNALRLSTESFSYCDHKRLQNCLRDNFKIKVKLHKKKNSWNIYVPNSEVKKFCSLVKPYIIPRMNYKISLTP